MLSVTDRYRMRYRYTRSCRCARRPYGSATSSGDCSNARPSARASAPRSSSATPRSCASPTRWASAATPTSRRALGRTTAPTAPAPARDGARAPAGAARRRPPPSRDPERLEAAARHRAAGLRHRSRLRSPRPARRARAQRARRARLAGRRRPPVLQELPRAAGAVGVRARLAADALVLPARRWPAASRCSSTTRASTRCCATTWPSATWA